MAPGPAEGARLDTNVLVAVRCRPFNTKEKTANEQSCVRILPDQIALTNPIGNGEDHSFGFDLIFDENSKQEEVWKEVGLPILNKALSGYNGTIFAYGQTGSGKTWSMQGGEGEQRGIIPRMVAAMFERIAEEKRARPTMQFLVTASYFEIYNEVIFDLLDPTDRKKRMSNNKGGLEIKEHPALGVYVKGLQEIVTENKEQLEAIIDQGMRHRTVASTQMNADSSRSHSVFIISVHQKDEAQAGANIFAKMNLVDLAGSERVKSTGATGATLKEGANINKSLSELGNVINALVECSKGKAVFIPYRNSKLTRVLQESLGGNSITSMLAACSPAACNFEETLSTLKYANRAKAIKVKAIKNEEATQINRLQDEIRMLKEKLQQQQLQQQLGGDVEGGNGDRDVNDAGRERRKGRGGAGGGAGDEGDGEMDEKARMRLRDLEEAMKNTWEQKAQLSSQYEHERNQLLAEQQYALRQLVLAKEKAWSLMRQKEQMESVLVYLKDLLLHNASGESGGSAVGGGLGNGLSDEMKTLMARMKRKKMAAAAVDGMPAPGGIGHADGPESRTEAKEGDDSQVFITAVTGVACGQSSVLLAVCDLWLETIQRLSGKEQQVKDEYLGVNMVRTALHADTQALVKITQEAVRSADHSFLQNLLEQIKEKATSLVETIPVYLHAQRDVMALLHALQSQYKQIHRQYKVFCQASPSMTELQQDVLKCLELLLEQIQRKISSCLDAINLSRRTIMSLLPLREEVAKVVGMYDQHIRAVRTDNPDLFDAQDSQRGENTKELRSLCDHIADYLDACSASLAEVVTLDNRHAATFQAIDQHHQEKQHRGGGGLAGTAHLPSSPVAVPETAVTAAGTPEGVGSRSTSSSRMIPPLTLSHLHSLIASTKLPLSGVSLTSLQTQCAELSATQAANAVTVASTASTETALAEVMNWEKLLGAKHSASKLLQRPPVRFLFDLMQHLAATCSGSSSVVGGGSPPPLDAENAEAMPSWPMKGLAEAVGWMVADWTVVSASKESKLSFMDRLLRIVSSCCSPSMDLCTTAVNIVTGSRADLTNLFLQQIALLVYTLQRYFHHEDNGAEMAISEARSTTPSTHVSPLIEQTQRPQTAREKEVDDRAGRDETLLLTEDDVVHYLSHFRQVLQSTCHLGKAVVALEVQARTVRQEIQRKNMEALAQEKALLAQALAHEKQSLLSNNQSLSDQVAMYAAQLQEMKRLLEKEAEYSASMEKVKQSLEQEVAKLHDELQGKEETIHKLSSTVFKYESSSEKDKAMIQHMQQGRLELEEQLRELQQRLHEASQENELLRNEKEDRENNLNVLIEERDAARQHEEELFESWTEMTQSLENLQESYVIINDKCNDLFDENLELKEEVQRLKDSLIEVQRQLLQPVSGPASQSRTSASFADWEAGAKEVGQTGASPGRQDGSARNGVREEHPMSWPSNTVGTAGPVDETRPALAGSKGDGSSTSNGLRGYVVKESKKPAGGSKMSSPSRVLSNGHSEHEYEVQGSPAYGRMDGDVGFHHLDSGSLASRSAPTSLCQQSLERAQVAASASMSRSNEALHAPGKDEEDYQEDFDEDDD